MDGVERAMSRSMTEPGCIFCSIVEGSAPARKVAEDDRTLAFLDIFPLTRGHALVIPKHHARDLLEVSSDDLAAVAAMAQRMARVSLAPEPDGLAAEA